MADPKLVTRRQIILGVARRWKAQYRDDIAKKSVSYGPHRGLIYEKLLRLDLSTCTADDVDVVIGNHSWTILICDGCDKDVEAAVTVGEEPDYESSTATLCEACLRAALALLVD
jgi:hypothetical protein